MRGRVDDEALRRDYFLSGFAAFIFLTCPGEIHVPRSGYVCFPWSTTKEIHNEYN